MRLPVTRTKSDKPIMCGSACVQGSLIGTRVDCYASCVDVDINPPVQCLTVIPKVSPIILAQVGIAGEPITGISLATRCGVPCGIRLGTLLRSAVRCVRLPSLQSSVWRPVEAFGRASRAPLPTYARLTRGADGIAIRRCAWTPLPGPTWRAGFPTREDAAGLERSRPAS